MTDQATSSARPPTRAESRDLAHLTPEVREVYLVALEEGGDDRSEAIDIVEEVLHALKG